MIAHQNQRRQLQNPRRQWLMLLRLSSDPRNSFPTLRAHLVLIMTISPMIPLQVGHLPQEVSRRLRLTPPRKPPARLLPKPSHPILRPPRLTLKRWPKYGLRQRNTSRRPLVDFALPADTHQARWFFRLMSHLPNPSLTRRPSNHPMQRKNTCQRNQLRLRSKHLRSLEMISSRVMPSGFTKTVLLGTSVNLRGQQNAVLSITWALTQQRRSLLMQPETIWTWIPATVLSSMGWRNSP